MISDLQRQVIVQTLRENVSPSFVYLFRQLFVMRVYKMYARLNEERSAILQKYIKS